MKKFLGITAATILVGLLVFGFISDKVGASKTVFDKGTADELETAKQISTEILKNRANTERELMMVKVRAVGKEREEMKRMADIFRGRIIDVTEKSYTIELTGDQSKNDAFLDAIERGAILETVRTGSSGIGRGERILRV